MTCNPANLCKQIDWFGLLWSASGIVSPRARSAILRDFLPVLTLENCVFHSLQVGEAFSQEMIDFLAEHPQVPLIQQAHLFKDFADVHYISRLDAVVVDTSVVHGGMGKTGIYAVAAVVPCWRWGLEADTTPWYPICTIGRCRLSDRGTNLWLSCALHYNKFATTNE